MSMMPPLLRQAVVHSILKRGTGLRYYDFEFRGLIEFKQSTLLCLNLANETVWPCFFYFVQSLVMHYFQMANS